MLDAHIEWTTRRSPYIFGHLPPVEPDVSADRTARRETVGDALLTTTEVTQAVGLTTGQVFRLVARGEFPAPLRLLRPTSVPQWRRSEVDAWIAAAPPSASSPGQTTLGSDER